jgi:DNA-binding response OmpR family regulator
MSKNADEAKKGNILIVEDSQDFSNLLKFLVEDDGFEGVQFPVEGGDIVAECKKLKPAVVLMDLALRHKGGMDYINELKADPSTKQTPIIIITGRDLGHKEVIELQMKNVKYLRKGRMEIDDIKEAIRKTVSAEVRR